GDQLHIGAQLPYADAVFGGGFTINGHLPVDTGGRAAILNVDGIAQIVLDIITQLGHGRGNIGINRALNPQIDRLASWRAILLRSNLHFQARNPGYPLADVLEYLGSLDTLGV